MASDIDHVPSCFARAAPTASRFTAKYSWLDPFAMTIVAGYGSWTTTCSSRSASMVQPFGVALSKPHRFIPQRGILFPQFATAVSVIQSVKVAWLWPWLRGGGGRAILHDSAEPRLVGTPVMPYVRWCSILLGLALIFSPNCGLSFYCFPGAPALHCLASTSPTEEGRQTMARPFTAPMTHRAGASGPVGAQRVATR